VEQNDLTGEAVAQRVLDALVAAGETLAVAESLTGGLLAASVVSVPGASRAFRGGVVAYATDLKERLLAVDPVALESTGPVDPTVAVQMAMGARWRLDATWALSTTGVAGPDPQPSDPSGAAVGTVYLGIAGPRIGQAVMLRLEGDREQIRAEAARQALLLLGVALGVVDPIDGQAGPGSPVPGMPATDGEQPGERAGEPEVTAGAQADAGGAESGAEAAAPQEEGARPGALSLPQDGAAEPVGGPGR